MHAYDISYHTQNTPATKTDVNWPGTCTLCCAEDWKLYKKAQILCTNEQSQHPTAHHPTFANKLIKNKQQIHFVDQPTLEKNSGTKWRCSGALNKILKNNVTA